MKTARLVFALMSLLLMLAACAEESEPTPIAEDYIRAIFSADEEEARSLACPDWEEGAIQQARTYAPLQPVTVETLTCEADGETVNCNITASGNYGGEAQTSREAAVSLRMQEDDGEWKVCGLAE